jgi:Domain of unknown function (DUF4388)
MAFQGSLAELHLPDIIQLISVSGKSGVFQLQDGALRGQIYLSDGKIIHAQLEETHGEEAVYALAIWSQGEFKFEPGVTTDQKTITKSNTNLLMEAARRLDEWRVLQKKIPSTDMLPEFVVLDNREGQINLNTMEWLILSKIDGHRSIKQIASGSGLSAFDASKILYGLIAAGLIKLKEGARPAAVTPARAATAASEKAATELLMKLNKMREMCHSLLGNVGESVVNKHYQKAKTELEKGAGFEAIEEAIAQITRAASILKGPSVTESLAEQLKSLR